MSLGRKKALHDSRTKPRRAKGKPTLAPSQATRMAAGRDMVRPTPTADPLKATIVGFLQFEMASASRPPLM
ncbi:hypothetical protein CCHR01_00719 [Colletotrichum chrysophilum]|uniref:Uncharacterized protein n=1 Tax=Colletotrichum chrysophilum TaxID=1836956 RepID=A0AAD9B0V8_9PEZI|nr:hypothetical protein CCHR01_00719 [Colletotrichum chrysophilum]